MRCHDARERMLEAPTQDLTPYSDSDIGAHLRGCDHCASIATSILRAQEAIAGARAGSGPRRSADAVLDAVLAEARPATKDYRRIVSNRKAWYAIVPLAAAAAVLWLVPGSAPEAPPNADHAIHQDTILRIDVPEGFTATIFATPNPDITVVWFYEEGQL